MLRGRVGNPLKTAQKLHFLCEKGPAEVGDEVRIADPAG
jgi:hypothetical protein